MCAYLEEKERKAKALAEEKKKVERRVSFEGTRLLAARAAAKAGFWYTANLLGFAVA